MTKIVMRLGVHDEKIRKKAMKVVAGISGVQSVEIDMKDKKLTVKGDVDPVKIANKLRKLCCTELLTVGEDKKDTEVKPNNKVEFTPHQYLCNYTVPPPPYYYHPVVVESSPSWWC